MRELNLDLDGVFVDFYRVAEGIIGRPYRDTPARVAWGLLDRVPHLFRDIPPTHDAFALWNGIQAFAAREGDVRIQVLSALPKLTNRLETAPQDKRQWVRSHLSETVPVILVRAGLAKTLAVAPSSILIDDLPRNIEAWAAAGGIGILHRDALSTLECLKLHTRNALGIT